MLLPLDGIMFQCTQVSSPLPFHFSSSGCPSVLQPPPPFLPSLWGPRFRRWMRRGIGLMWTWCRGGSGGEWGGRWGQENVMKWYLERVSSGSCGVRGLRHRTHPPAPSPVGKVKQSKYFAYIWVWISSSSLLYPSITSAASALTPFTDHYHHSNLSTATSLRPRRPLRSLIIPSPDWLSRQFPTPH